MVMAHASYLYNTAEYVGELVVAPVAALGGVGEADVHSVPSKFDGARTYLVLTWNGT
jgi:hypothetical protein